jgi:hypothetical protein
MTEILQQIAPNVSQLNRFPPVVVKQYDKGLRTIRATIMDGKTPLTADPACTVLVNARRQDGEAKSFAGAVNEDGTVSVPVAYWMTEVEGSVYCDISLVGNEAVLTTTTFELCVQYAANGDGDVSQDDDVGILVDLISQCRDIETVEALRVKAEAARVEAENARVTAENERASAEETRKSNETTRKSNETKRQNAETARATAETARASAEETRASNEETRQSNETTRQTNEAARANAETARATAETARVKAEAARIEAEKARVEAENERASHEDSRLQSEANAKASAEAAASSQTAAATSATNAAESERVSAEYLEQVKTITTGAQGYYTDEAALKKAVPVGEDGWWAVNGETDSIWVWDSDTSAWVDSHDMTELGDYYTRTQVDSKIEQVTSVRYTITVPADGWITDAANTVDEVDGDSVLYYNTVDVDGMTADTELDCIRLAPAYMDNADAVTAYQTWSYLDTAANYVYFYSATKPTATFAVTAIVVK